MSEQLLFLAAHPLAYPALRLIGRCGPVVRVPGVGVVVNDAALARRVLLDADAFRKSGPGSSGALWTPVLGPSVLLNMDGDAHAALRRKLGGLFTAGAVTGLCERVLAGPLAAASERLADGGTVDVVDLARTCAGAVICALIGLDADEAACRRMYARGEEIAAMVGLRTKELSPRQVATARRVLGEITEPAGRAYDAGDPATVVGRMRELGLSREEALGAAAAFFLTGTETVASFLPRFIALLGDGGPSPARGAALTARLAGRVRSRGTPSGSTRAAGPLEYLSRRRAGLPAAGRGVGRGESRMARLADRVATRWTSSGAARTTSPTASPSSAQQPPVPPPPDDLTGAGREPDTQALMARSARRFLTRWASWGSTPSTGPTASISCRQTGLPAGSSRAADSTAHGSALASRLARLLRARWTSSGTARATSPVTSPSSDLDRFIEEALRHTTPSPVMLRSVAVPATVGTVAVRPGERVLIATYTCTRVPGRGFAPDEPVPDLGRLWFGSGPHFCIGYPLAMAQIQMVAGALLRHAPLRVVRRRYATRVLIPGYRELAVTRA